MDFSFNGKNVLRKFSRNKFKKKGKRKYFKIPFENEFYEDTLSKGIMK